MGDRISQRGPAPDRGGAPLALDHGFEDAWAEPPTSLSRSILWDLQAAYFAERGIDAWRQGEVPHYVTSNPTIAAAYAEIVFAFRRTCCVSEDSRPAIRR